MTFLLDCFGGDDDTQTIKHSNIQALLKVIFIGGHELGDDSHDVADDGIVSDGVDGSVRVGVDADDFGALFHAGAVLDGAADATSDVEFRADGDTRLADLAFAFAEASVDGSSGSSDRAADEVSEAVEQLEILLAAHAVATGDDDLSTLDVDFLFLDFAGEDFDSLVGAVDIFAYGDGDDDTLIIGIEDFLFHDTLADGSHLGTSLRAYNGSDDVAAEGGAYLHEDVLVGLARLDILMVADFEGGAVGGEAAAEIRGDARGEVAAHRRGAEEDDLRFLILDDAAENLEVRHGAIGREATVLSEENLIDTILVERVGDGVDVGAEESSLEFASEAGSQLAAFGAKFEANVSDGVFLGELAIY